MVKRLLIGIIKGLLIGSALSAGLVMGLGLLGWGAPLAYLFAAVTGVLTALLAGKPFWAPGARVETILKSVGGLALATGLMFAARRWLGTTVDLSAWGLGQGALGLLPATSIPLVATVLAVLFEVDNTGTEGDEPSPGKKKRVKGSGEAGSRKRVGEVVDGELDEDLEVNSQSKGKRRA